MKWLYYIIIAIVALCIGFGAGNSRQKSVDRDTIFSTQRTIDIRHDTIVSVNPLPILAYFSSNESIKVPDTILPREFKVCKDSNYRVVISGISPRLDSIEVYPETRIIHDIKTQSITKLSKPTKWLIGLQVGYGVTKSGLSPYAGIGIGYRLW